MERRGCPLHYAQWLPALPSRIVSIISKFIKILTVRTSVNDLIELIKQGEVSFQESAWEKVSAEAKDLVSHLLQKNYKERYSPSQALAHPWIQNVTALFNSYLISLKPLQIGRVSNKEMDATIRNLKTNLRRNARRGFMIEPMSGLIANRAKINSMVDENEVFESRPVRQRGVTVSLARDVNNNKVAAKLFERVNEEDDEEQATKRALNQ